jgi:bifunctional DNase/RNase
MMEMVVADVAFDQRRDETFAVLRQRGGDAECAVRISRHTAALIQARLQGRRFRRPLTYDLLLQVTGALGARFARAVLESGPRQAVEAFLDVEAGPAGIIELPCGLEDAVGVAACAGVRVYLSDELSGRLGRPFGDPAG